MTLLPIERVVVDWAFGDGRAWLAASKEPLALVVREAGGFRALGTGQRASIEELRERIPGFDDLLASI